MRQARPRETAALMCPCAEWISAPEIARSGRSSAPGHTARAQSTPSQPGSHLVRVRVIRVGNRVRVRVRLSPNPNPHPNPSPAPASAIHAEAVPGASGRASVHLLRVRGRGWGRVRVGLGVAPGSGSGIGLGFRSWLRLGSELGLGLGLRASGHLARHAGVRSTAEARASLAHPVARAVEQVRRAAHARARGPLPPGQG